MVRLSISARKLQKVNIMQKEEKWKFDINRYERLIHLKDLSTTLKTIEYCDSNLADIRKSWPNQTKIFDDMDRSIINKYNTTNQKDQGDE